jgi:hypothetical protein
MQQSQERDGKAPHFALAAVGRPGSDYPLNDAAHSRGTRPAGSGLRSLVDGGDASLLRLLEHGDREGASVGFSIRKSSANALFYCRLAVTIFDAQIAYAAFVKCTPSIA